MIFKNKKTGEVENWCIDKDVIRTCDGSIVCDSLAELNEEWEDYEEPKEHWIINSISGIETTDRDENDEPGRAMIEIGNYFETKEEAEKAVEKLKAWKRLKDKGAEFYGWRRNQTGTYELYMRWEDRIPRSYEVKNDLDLLFGGEDA